MYKKVQHFTAKVLHFYCRYDTIIYVRKVRNQMKTDKNRITIVIDQEMKGKFEYIKKILKVKQNKTVLKYLINHFLQWKI